LSAGAIIDSVFEDLRRFTSGVRPVDDMTLVVVKAQDSPAAVPDWQI
jgi:hypothetical protein